jgi:hypothetical protein
LGHTNVAFKADAAGVGEKCVLERNTLLMVAKGGWLIEREKCALESTTVQSKPENQTRTTSL